MREYDQQMRERAQRIIGDLLANTDDPDNHDAVLAAFRDAVTEHERIITERRAAQEAAAAPVEDVPTDDAAPRKRRRKAADPDSEGDATSAAS